jgi:hypothetical protein
VADTSTLRFRTLLSLYNWIPMSTSTQHSSSDDVNSLVADRSICDAEVSTIEQNLRGIAVTYGLTPTHDGVYASVRITRRTRDYVSSLYDRTIAAFDTLSGIREDFSEIGPDEQLSWQMTRCFGPPPATRTVLGLDALDANTELQSLPAKERGSIKLAAFAQTASPSFDLKKNLGHKDKDDLKAALRALDEAMESKHRRTIIGKFGRINKKLRDTGLEPIALQEKDAKMVIEDTTSDNLPQPG